MVGTLRDVVDDPRVKPALISPINPLLRVRDQLHMKHSVDQRGRHGFHDSAVLRTVAGTDHHTALRQMIFPYASFVNQAVKGLLHLLRTGVQLVEEQDVRFLSGDHFGRNKPRSIAVDLWNTDDVLRRELTAEKRHAGHSHIVGEFLHQRGFTDAGRSPYEDRTYRGKIEQQVR